MSKIKKLYLFSSGIMMKLIKDNDFLVLEMKKESLAQYAEGKKSKSSCLYSCF